MEENKLKIELPIIGDKIYTSPEKGTNVIYEATYMGEPCYLIKHVPTKYSELFEHDEALCKDIITKIKRRGALCVTYTGKNSKMLRFNPTNREKKLSLRQLVLARYENKSVSKIRGYQTYLRDKSLMQYGFADLRRCNLYTRGTFRSDKENPSLGIYENPNNPEEKCLTVTYRSGDKKHTEVYAYSKELHEMLATSNLCGISYKRESDRLIVKVNHGDLDKNDRGWCPKNLGHFVLLYYTHFFRFRKRNGAIKQFIHNIPKLSQNYKGKEAAHLNAIKRIGGTGNLMWMNKTTNIKMKDLAACFRGEYNFFPIVTEDNEILVDFTSHGKTFLYKCATPEDYLDMQLILMGRSVHTKDFWAMRARTGEKILTPKETYEEVKKQEQSQLTVEEMVAEYWAWCEHRDRLLKQYREYPDDFLTWPSLSDEITEEQCLGIANLMVGGA